MSYGKQFCEFLKRIRQRIASENGIVYKASECFHVIDCAGTCPQCDAELIELQKRLGEKIEYGVRLGDEVDYIGYDHSESKFCNHPLRGCPSSTYMQEKYLDKLQNNKKEEDDLPF